MVQHRRIEATGALRQPAVPQAMAVGEGGATPQIEATVLERAVRAGTGTMIATATDHEAGALHLEDPGVPASQLAAQVAHLRGGTAAQRAVEEEGTDDDAAQAIRVMAAVVGAVAGVDVADEIGSRVTESEVNDLDNQAVGRIRFASRCTPTDSLRVLPPVATIILTSYAATIRC